MKILYILGRGRSGSTLLESLLRERLGAFGAGELRLWDKSVGTQLQCSCGDLVDDCSFWQSTFTDTSELIDPEFLKSYRRIYRKRNLLLLVLPKGAAIASKVYAREAGLLRKLYISVEKNSNNSLIVDSSKNPFYCFFLSEVVKLDVVGIHLTRDPRAVAFSWFRQKTRDQAVPLYQKKMGSIASSVFWLGSNVCSELVKAHLKKSVLVRYEDLALDLNSELGRIQENADIEDSGILRDAEANHSLCGNPIRFKEKKLNSVKNDSEWIVNMSYRSKLIVSLITLPIKYRYKY